MPWRPNQHFQGGPVQTIKVGLAQTTRSSEGVIGDVPDLTRLHDTLFSPAGRLTY